ncbi:1-deoxy-D-xylulose-5-phosphate synthase [Fibrobacter sp. UWH9]|uniref:1-deoxy-D-xylulose-5-phosphate synthase n=1 Tax=unclassified Fibrobacter TaxID=2634177 RepID=UPI0009221B9E|nr:MULTISPECIES: 1-deoxy-D-xylulose-5-phosphate synthase [Fibrobacter]MCQ2098907.1 1-deoxy-D-xylulose-5-phosphate synthase [Fibrobacter sp.]MCL4102229.1 1-deoxy-D-xylulose-5-phosphate synthase [Fibrobacter succinogenes]MDO4947283.1 1-deoxy-D-xylulose-5-phosphate synthase [Fibrobacter sp.]OWV05928.1 1-deoxy-D-xylulose-5-phosphate synthase [Fibrobacter sp. UWH3]SHH12122.1 1-deoxy-D-xylulose-5-phosphate synthase [Fibrobacter sp. UWH9]
MDLKSIKSPQDIKHCSVKELEQLASQIRETIIGQVSKHGGHLASSLGVVELTLALHYVYNAPEDKIVWDVGHQAYVHKLLTGRIDRFGTLRQQGGISGFLKRNESEYDCYGAGHATTSISAALGFAVARNHFKRKNNVVAVIGDGSMTGGMAYEALNNAGISKQNMTIILNDNKMSIAPNVGGFSKYLNRVISDPVYNKMRTDLDRLMKRLPGILGSRFRDLFLQVESAAKTAVKPGQFFEDLGVRYFGPIDGHDIDELIMILERVKSQPGPCLVHVLTEKGRGMSAAVANPTKFHGCGPFDPESGLPLAPGKPNPSLTSIFGKTLLEIAKKDNRVIGITAAMPTGCGMDIVAKELPDRVIDVGIAEEHALTFASGLACDGVVPVVAIYSSFMQRAYDQIMHDIALQNLHVVMVLDRAGLVGADGPTHHGVFDLSFLRTVPGITILAPSNENELRDMIQASIDMEGPVAIRYPRGTALAETLEPATENFDAKLPKVLEQGKDILLLGAGFMTNELKKTASVLRENGYNPTLVDARIIKPLDEECYRALFESHKTIVTLEDNTLVGGFGSAIGELLMDLGITDKRLLRFGLPDKFVEQGEISALYKLLNIDGESVAKQIMEKL